MSYPAACPRSRELVPLSEIQNRAEAMERCFAPIIALGTISIFDAYRRNEGPRIDNESILFLDNPNDQLWLPRVITYTGLTLENSLPGYGDIQHALDIRDDEDKSKIQAQKELINKYMFYGAESLGISLHVSLHDQATMLGRLILPTVLDLKEQPHTAGSTAELLKSDELDKICKSLSFSANGAWADVLTLSSENVMLTTQSLLREYAHKHGGIEEDLLKPISLQEMFKRSEKSGEIVVSDIVVKILRKYMRLDNERSIVNNGSHAGAPSRLNGSRGCPASIKSVRMLPDDLTESQMQRLTAGENPIAKYDEGEKMFTLLRSPITEYNHLIADILSPKSN